MMVVYPLEDDKFDSVGVRFGHLLVLRPKVNIVREDVQGRSSNCAHHFPEGLVCDLVVAH